MKAGRLKYKLIVRRPVVTANRFGEKSTVWERCATVWAERRKLTGSRSDEVGEAFADYRTEWNVRDAHHIEEGWRVEHMGGHLYTVVSVIPNIDRGFNTLVCKRINE